MKIKVKFSNEKLIKNYLSVLSVFSILISIFSFAIEFENINKVIIIIILIFFWISIYLLLWIKANFSTYKKFTINGSIVEVKVGDIFEEEEFKVISFNEYFDTKVDDNIISHNSLNGIYLNDFFDENEIKKLDLLIVNDLHLKDKIISKDSNRIFGKKIKYMLGSIFKNKELNDYMLVAFSKFDENNRAYLSIYDFINFLLEFWNEIDSHYAGKSVSIPLFGSGITRFKDFDISEQELLELLIWSFKISRIKIKYPSRIKIIIHESIKDKINFYKLY